MRRSAFDQGPYANEGPATVREGKHEKLCFYPTKGQLYEGNYVSSSVFLPGEAIPKKRQLREGSS